MPPPLSSQQHPPSTGNLSRAPPSVLALFNSIAPVPPHPASPLMIVNGNQPTTPKSSRNSEGGRFPGVASMPLLGENRPLVPFYATPPRIGPQFLLRRQHSSTTAVCAGSQKGRYPAGVVGKHGRYTTPPPMRYGCGMAVHKGSDEEEKIPTLHFAASKFTDSPSAKSLPPPPSQWMEEIESRVAEKKALVGEDEKIGSKTKKSMGMDGIEEEEATSDDTGVVFDLDDASPTASFDNDNISSAPNSAAAGIRVDPMKLIAAASHF